MHGVSVQVDEEEHQEEGGPLLGCFVVDEDLVGASRQRREELRAIERAERREKGLPSDDESDAAEGASRRRRQKRRRYRRGRRKERRWNAIAAPEDLVDVHGERVASALHDALLAVRELCSFALEQDGRWSSVNNQRKYRISQLYSSLLDTIRADQLRDPEHLRKVAAASTTPLARDDVRVFAPRVSQRQPGGPAAVRGGAAAADVLLQLASLHVAQGALAARAGALVDGVHAVLLRGRQVPRRPAHGAAGG